MAYDPKDLAKLIPLLKKGDLIETNLNSSIVEGPPFYCLFEQAYEDLSLHVRLFKERTVSGAWSVVPTKISEEDKDKAIFRLVCPVELMNLDGKLMSNIMAGRELAKVLKEIAAT